MMTLPWDDGLLVKILDFGIAKSLEADSGTATGMMIGTAYYMSPEQFQGLKGIDRRTDLWSLACVAYEMLLGERVFDGPSVIAIGMRILAQERPLPSQRRPGLPAGFDAWFVKALAANAEDRFDSALELAETLAIALEVDSPGTSVSSVGSEVGVGPQRGAEFSTTQVANSAFTPAPKAKPGASAARGVIAAAAVALVAATGAAGLVAVRRPTAAPPQPVPSTPELRLPASAEPPPPGSAAIETPLLDRATTLLSDGDADAAHRLVADLPGDSPLRLDARFSAVENAWVDIQVSRAEAESDVSEKRRMLSMVLSSGADELRKARARRVLEAISASRSNRKASKIATQARAPDVPRAAAADRTTPSASPTSALPPRF